MIYRCIKFKTQPTIIYVMEHQWLFDVEDELMITSLLRSAGMIEQVMLSQDPKESLVAIKKYWMQAKNLFVFCQTSVLKWQCTKCGRLLPRLGAETHIDLHCPDCHEPMNKIARIDALPWEN